MYLLDALGGRLNLFAEVRLQLGKLLILGVLALGLVQHFRLALRNPSDIVVLHAPVKNPTNKTWPP